MPREIAVHECVNVTADPQLKEKVLRREVNSVRCPHCLEDTLASGFRYHDRPQRFMIWLRPDGGRDGGEDVTERKVRLNLEEMDLRIVHDYDSLIEKVRIFDNKLDDCLVEFLKLALWSSITGKSVNRFTGNRIRLIGLSWPLLRFEARIDSRRRMITCPYDEYLRHGADVAAAKGLIRTGEWVVVDRDFILENVGTELPTGFHWKEKEPEQWEWEPGSAPGILTRLKTAWMR